MEPSLEAAVIWPPLTSKRRFEPAKRSHLWGRILLNCKLLAVSPAKRLADARQNASAPRGIEGPCHHCTILNPCCPTVQSRSYLSFRVVGVWVSGVQVFRTEDPP